MGFVWNIITGKNLQLNEIARVTALQPVERAQVPKGSKEAATVFSFALAVDTFVKALTIESSDKAFAAIGRNVRHEPLPLERLASFGAWLLERRTAGRAESVAGQAIASIIATYREAMYPVDVVVNAAMERYGDEEDRYVAVRQGGGVPRSLGRTLVYAICDVLGVWHPSGYTVDDILGEDPNYDPADAMEQMLYAEGLVVNLSDSLLVG
jgi:hypothetical protein